MQSNIVAALKQRYRFDEWNGAIVSAERLFAYRYAIRGREVPGWTLVKLTQMRAALDSTTDDREIVVEIQRAASPFGRAAPEPVRVVSLPRSRHATIAGTPFDLPPTHTRSFWQNAELSPDVRVEAELHECGSIGHAHEWLIHLLAPFESPLIRRIENPPFGDICFGGPAPTAFIYARGNMVINVRNAARYAVDVNDVARSLDADLIAAPPTPDAERRRAREVDAIRRVATGEEIPLDVVVSETRAAAPELLQVTSKIFYTGGSVESDAEKVYFLAAEPGTYRIRIYSTDPSDRVQFQELPIEVSARA